MKKILIAILALAAILRVVGIYPGYHPNHSDEVNIYSQAVNILKTGSLEELRYEYPPLPAYINFLAFKYIFIPISWERFYIENLGEVIDGTLPLKPNIDTYKSLLQVKILGERDINAMYWSRTVTALIGVGIVFLIYLIGTHLFDERVGLISSFLIAINYRQVLNSHFGLPDIYNAFFLCLAFFLTLVAWKKATFRNYFLAAVCCGISFSTKYQFFSFVPFGIVILFNRTIINRKVFIIPFVIAAVFLILNPYFFVNFNIAKEQLAYAALKYRFGKNFLDFYPISYLYSYGIGKLTSVLILIGIPFALSRKFKEGVLLLSICVPIFYYLIYLTGGAFYTRNFISVTPFLVIFAGFILSKLLTIKFKYLGYVIFGVLILFCGYENIQKDIIVLENYTRPWNQDLILSWIRNNIPSNAKIAAHSSVPIPDSYNPRLDYEFYPAFSMDEFREESADYAIANYEWETNDFYWWMTQNTIHSLKYFNKPAYLLGETYPGLALREIEDFGIYSLIKPTFAPDANFLVAKVPNYVVTNKIIVDDFNFVTNDNGWTKVGSNLNWKDGSLQINKQGVAESFVRWESPPVKISSKGFEIEYKIKTDETLNKREGFLFVEFYKNGEGTGVRLSKRNDIYNKWVDDSFAGEIPAGTDYIKIGFQVYNSAYATVSLKDVKIYSATVVNINRDEVHHIEINPDILYPISQGNM